MANLRYGLKEVANVVFFDLATRKPVIFFDTLKVSSIENEAETAEARGGQGNNKLMSWDYGRTANLTMQDALLSDTSLALLAGNAKKEASVSAPIRISANETLTTVVDGTAPASKVTLAQTPVTGTVFAYTLEGGLLATELTATVQTKDVKMATGAPAGTKIMVFYEYDVTSNANKITFSGNAFPATYRVVGDTVVRGEDGIDRKAQFIVPKAKLQSSFSLAMDAENVSTFDFNLEVIMESSTQTLYDIIRLG